MEDKELFKDHMKKHSEFPKNQCVICGEEKPDGYDFRTHVRRNVS